MNIPKFFTTVTPLSKGLAIALFVCLPFGGFYFGSKYNQSKVVEKVEDKKVSSQKNNTASDVIQKTNQWSKPVANDISIPLVKEGKLYVYSLANKKLIKTKYDAGYGGGAFGYGNTDATLSPDGRYVAFINREDGNTLYILPSGSLEAIKLTDFSVQYINSWSSDSSKILYYCNLDNLDARKQSEGEGPGPVWETVESFSKEAVSGFHSFNINTGENLYLYPLLTAYKFIDDKRIIVETSETPNINTTRLVLFNVDDFTADYKTVNYVIKSFSRQMSFSADGKFWATSFGNTDTGVNIAFSKFPNQDETIVESGSWATIQWPILSPTGRYLAYTKRAGEIKPGMWANKVIIWDSTLKRKIIETDGWPQYWIGNDKLLIGVGGYSSAKTFGYDSYTIFDTNKGDTEVLQLNE